MDMESEKSYFARADELVVQELGDELLIYDQRTDIAHCLSDVAADVWRSCESGASADAMTQRLAEHRLAGVDGIDEAAALVEAAISELSEKGLLNYSVAGAGLVSRRHALRRIAGVGAAALAVPLVVSAAVPKPADAAGSPPTCIGLNASGCTPVNSAQASNTCCTQFGQNCDSTGKCRNCSLNGTAVTCDSTFVQALCCSGTCKAGACATCTPQGQKPNGVNCGTSNGQANALCCSGICGTGSTGRTQCA